MYIYPENIGVLRPMERSERVGLVWVAVNTLSFILFSVTGNE